MSKPVRQFYSVVVLFIVIAGSIFLLVNNSATVRHYRELKMGKPQTTPVEVVGEVVDSWCYASQTMGPGRGDGHLACALKCIAGGVTPGVLEEKTMRLYLCVKGQGYEGCQRQLIQFVGKRVKVTGVVGTLGGNRVMKLRSVELAPVGQWN